ncbi:MAG: thermonuclease family protein [Bacillota bacterium]
MKRNSRSAKLADAYRSPFQTQRRVAAGLGSNTGIILFVAAVIVVAIIAVTATRRSAPADNKASEHVQQIRVVDGDTLDLDGRRIRLHGIDAPEKGQLCTKNGESYDCGEASKQHLTYLLIGERLICSERSKDRWGREVAMCLAGTADVAALMVRHGWAVAYAEYSKDYVEDERFARTNGMGLWAKDFVPPKEWRNIQRN